jgi:MoaA/NifB/PqqE/SkfB family radical SAM enzyme
MNISINPTYFCNFRCSSCYLTEQQLSDSQQIDIDKLDQLLCEINRHQKITHVDLYGGEIGVLQHKYLIQLHNTIRTYYTGNINVITNLSHIHPYLLRPDIDLSVSYDFECREKHELVLKNISMIQKDVHILLLASKQMITKNIDDMIHLLNVFSNISTVEIKPYSTNQANAETVSFKDYEEFVKGWIVSEVPKRFNFTNEHNIRNSLSGNTNSFSDDHIYITPQGRYGVLEFDINDNEFFLQFDTIDQYTDWTQQEKKRVSANKFCNNCQYFGNCLSEHLREVTTIENSCNGFKLLLDWYNERMED